MNLKSKSLWTKDFILTSLSNLFLFYSFHMLTPTLPVFIVAKGGDKFEAGLVIGIFTVTALVIRPFAGSALNVMDRKKILLSGLFVFAISAIGYNWMMSVAMILIMRAIQGIGWGIATTTYGTMASDLIIPQRRAEGMGYYGLSINIAMACAPLFGIWLMKGYGFTVLFFVSALSVVISLLLSNFINFPTPSHVIGRGKAQLDKAPQLIDKGPLFPAFLIMLMTLGHGGILSFLTLFGQEVGIKNVGWFFLANSIMLIFIRPISGRISDKKGHPFVLIPGGLSLGFGLLLISYSTNVTSLIIAALFYGIGFGSIQPALQAWTISKAHPERIGSANAVYFSAFDLGVGMGALLLGFFAKWIGYATIYKVALIFVVLYGTFYSIYLIRNKQRKLNLQKQEKLSQRKYL